MGTTDSYDRHVVYKLQVFGKVEFYEKIAF